MKYKINQNQAVWETSHWEVEACSREDALEKFEDGEATLVFVSSDRDPVDGVDQAIDVTLEPVFIKNRGA